MKTRLARYASLIHGTPPLQAESLVRSLLVQYFFHVSNKAIVEVVGGADGSPRTLNLLAPTVFKGRGRIRVASTTVFGWATSPFSYRCSYVEARNPDATITIGDRTTINNAAVLIAEGAGIRIGAGCLIGTEFQVLDTNAHELEPGRRHLPDSRTRQVIVGDGVFIGSRVTLLKGCSIGDHCIVGAGAVVTTGFVAPAMSIVAGNPARIVGRVPEPGSRAAAEAETAAGAQAAVVAQAAADVSPAAA